jgi:hypothetical protein
VPGEKTCSHCGKDYPTGRLLYAIPSVIVLFMVCCGICFGYLRVLAEFSIWLSAVLTIPIVVVFIAAMIKMASWSDCRDECRWMFSYDDFAVRLTVSCSERRWAAAVVIGALRGRHR